ncbi:ABC transporter ATP-binding protein [Kaustia mangrovi]|uniref:ABC transporter ATP-binding protein n=1 Tax=Kaustia mangrovi TaxID=2593653 RepID=A0A7S8C6J7_9HYPH|nr:ABC transporter ATP-binding protein [Kaustia mangrovi]QPC44304.1 ABC transporter ATP-binding protein [Kaustia mangrovi]
MFRWFEQLIDPLRTPEQPAPPDRLGPFFWYFARQVWPVLAAVMAVGLAVALIEVQMFNYVGRIVDILRQTTPEDLIADYGGELLVMALVIGVARPVATAAHLLLVHQAIEPNLTNLVRWQTHRYVLRQSMSFFQNDFAGRIANKIIQTGPSLRECVVSLVDAIWFVSVYAASAMFLFAEADPRLMIPLSVWIVLYVGILWTFVPRIKRQAAVMSEARSALTGRIVDSYTNIMTVKLFSHADREDTYARESVDDHTAKFKVLLRNVTAMSVLLTVVNGLLIVGTCALAVWLWQASAITVGAIALATGLVIRINNMSGWIMWVVTTVFENLGTVEEGMETISRPYEITDRPRAPALKVAAGAIGFDHIRFHYGKEGGVIDDLSLAIRPGERVGLIGRSGAGKSTLVNLLLRFHDLEGGRILIDGQDISAVTQESLRAAIGVVSQDTSLLHRSVRDNISYGHVDAGEREIVEAARKAQAHEFILDLEDLRGRRGYDAHVGERGVKLSGGQRQRIAIARVLLKDAPILVLDEATSALDSEIEVAIQNQLYELMEGKTVIAIAHRLSTIARMDRLIVLDRGRIVEDGSHEALLEKGGLYSQLWNHQSGGFLDLGADAASEAAE